MDFDWDNRLICPISCDLKYEFHLIQNTLIYKGEKSLFFLGFLMILRTFGIVWEFFSKLRKIYGVAIYVSIDVVWFWDREIFKLKIDRLILSEVGCVHVVAYGIPSDNCEKLDTYYLLLLQFYVLKSRTLK